MSAMLNLKAWPAFAELPEVATATRERVARRVPASARLRFDVSVGLFTGSSCLYVG